VNAFLPRALGGLELRPLDAMRLISHGLPRRSIRGLGRYGAGHSGWPGRCVPTQGDGEGAVHRAEPDRDRGSGNEAGPRSAGAGRPPRQRAVELRLRYQARTCTYCGRCVRPGASIMC
jgi:hypothetical protein